MTDDDHPELHTITMAVRDLEQRYFDEVEARSTDNAQAEIDASGLFEDFSKGPEGRPGQ